MTKYKNFPPSLEKSPWIATDEKPYDEAVELLRGILCESGQECEYDKDIYEFLKENNELPEDYTPYWEEEDEE